MTVLYLDTETYSPTPIKHGLHRYAEKVEVMLAPWAIDEGEAEVWDRTADYMPLDLDRALRDPAVTVVIHNSQFDRTVMRQPHDMGLDLPLSRIFDTMACALSHGLPGGLDALCGILGVPMDQAKDKAGKALIQLFCKPNTKGERNTRETHPLKWAEFKEYARSDIKAMREVYKRLPKWNYPTREGAVFALDQRINDRGVAVDVELAEAAVRAVDDEQALLAARTRQLTNGEVQAATQRDAMLKHILAQYEIALPDMTASTLERRIEDPDLPEGLRELLRVRLQSTTTSTAKYRKLLEGVSSDGRLRGTLQYCGASRTGRWSGRLFQPQNLPRPALDAEVIEDGIAALKAGCADMMFDNIMELTSSAIRGCIVAAPGKKLVVADLSNIEGRVLVWLAGERWKLDAFKAYDTFKLDEHGNKIPDGKGDFVRMGPDLYKMAYAKAFKISPDEVTKDQRQVGKVMELALGYEGGVGAFLTFAAAYGIDLDDLARNLEGSVPDDVQAECNKFWAWAVIHGKTLGLKEETFKACDALKRLWRRAHPAVVQFWANLGETVREAVAQPGKTFIVAAATNGEVRLKIRRDGAWLRVVLPSGRALCYPQPAMKGEDCKACEGTGKVTETYFCEEIDEDVERLAMCPECFGDGEIGKPRMTYMGINQYSRKWSRIATYGGKLAENVTQAVARDVLAEGMKLAEASGYEVVLSVHDELLTETPSNDNFTAEGLAACMTAPLDWYAGLPLAAAGFEASRYKKE